LISLAAKTFVTLKHHEHSLIHQGCLVPHHTPPPHACARRATVIWVWRGTPAPQVVAASTGAWHGVAASQTGPSSVVICYFVYQCYVEIYSVLFY
jgi:hypothetical protein